MTYDTARTLADSWGLVFMGLAWTVLIGWHFRPGGTRNSRAAAMMIFDDEAETTSDRAEADHG